MHCCNRFETVRWLLPVTAWLLSGAAAAQTPDSATAAVYQQYTKTSGNNLQLYNGPAYQAYYPNTEGSAFLHNQAPRPATVGYNGVVYYGIPLTLDLVSSEVVVATPAQSLIKLQPHLLQFFVLDGQRYVHLVPDSTNSNNLPDDVYALLHDGTAKLYARRRKAIRKALRAENRDYFMESNRYFIFYNRQYTPVSNQKELLQALGVDKNSLQAFWKSRGLQYKKDPETFIRETVQEWERTKK